MAESRKSICILSTGGTITMHKTAEGFALAPGYLKDAMEKIPELSNADMPAYTIHELDKPMDSSNMRPSDWCKMGSFIEHHYDQYDGFVILHGTDTMAYTASALSFMLENLGKPVILTGSQLPLFETRSDARGNLINALLMASNPRIAEVCIYFNNKLFRGNRSKKVDAISFSAFDSPNFPALGKVGTDIRVRRDLLREVSKEKIKLHNIDSIAVHTLRIFPGVSHEILHQFLNMPSLQALILETYGVGTAPENLQFTDAIKKLIDKGILVVNCSQCAHAKIKMSDYATGLSLLKAGVISCGDMTMEAAIAKIFYLFNQKLALTEIKKQMTTNLRGELSN